jgi:hypothetical protein
MASATQMFINSPLTVTQDANVYGSSLDAGNYDYTFVINVSGLSADITGLFANAAFKQNGSDMNAVDVNLTILNSNTYTNWGNLFNNQSIVTVLQGESAISFSTLQGTTNKTIGDRLLEVVAHKLFGHGQARAAIKNDTEFYAHDAEIWDHLCTSLANTNIRHDIFNQYVATGRYTPGSNDVQEWVNFNLNGLTLDYPLYLAGNMLTDASLTNDERNIVQNGPNVGGTLLVNGLYNVPVLVRFVQ